MGPAPAFSGRVDQVLRLVAGVVAIVGTLLLSRRYEQVDLWRFALCWWGVVLVLSGAVRLRHRCTIRSPTT